MVISKNSQLGLRLNEVDTQVAFYKCLVSNHELLEKHYKTCDEELKKLEDLGDGNYEIPDDHYMAEELKDLSGAIEKHKDEREIREKVTMAIGEQNVIDETGSSYYFICESVYKCAELIKINDNFTGRTLKDINFGKYTYLMGKHKMVRFVVARGAIKGFYWDEEDEVALEWGIDIETGGYFFDGMYGESWALEFSTVMRILTFVELGDIEVIELKAGRNNGATKKSGDKVANTSNNTVFVVDSTWNKILIRTDGFAVRGHFRLQPCGSNMADRKLIWINAFEKHGFTRKAKAEIVH